MRMLMVRISRFCARAMHVLNVKRKVRVNEGVIGVCVGVREGRNLEPAQYGTDNEDR